MKEKKTFAEKHPKINFLIGLLYQANNSPAQKSIAT